MRMQCSETEPHLAGVWATLGLIAISAVCGALTDLSFSLRGYMWQILNCALTAGYSLSLRGAMDKASGPRGLLLLVILWNISRTCPAFDYSALTQ